MDNMFAMWTPRGYATVQVRSEGNADMPVKARLRFRDLGVSYGDFIKDQE